MHETNIMEGALETAVKMMRDQGGKELKLLILEVGSLSGVITDALQFAFTALKGSYSALSADLCIHWVEAKCLCESCNEVFSFAENGYLCPSCREPSLTILCGRELEISRIEWI
jgi:hydrogenase nickel incorporation protein HypA/HybF